MGCIIKVLIWAANCVELSTLNAWNYVSGHFVFYKTN